MLFTKLSESCEVYFNIAELKVIKELIIFYYDQHAKSNIVVDFIFYVNHQIFPEIHPLNLLILTVLSTTASNER